MRVHPHLPPHLMIDTSSHEPKLKHARHAFGNVYIDFPLEFTRSGTKRLSDVIIFKGKITLYG